MGGRDRDGRSASAPPIGDVARRADARRHVFPHAQRPARRRAGRQPVRPMSRCSIGTPRTSCATACTPTHARRAGRRRVGVAWRFAPRRDARSSSRRCSSRSSCSSIEAIVIGARSRDEWPDGARCVARRDRASSRHFKESSTRCRRPAIGSTVGGLPGSADAAMRRGAGAAAADAILRRGDGRRRRKPSGGSPISRRCSTDTPIALYPPREGFGEAEPHMEVAGERVETLERLTRGELRVLLTTGARAARENANAARAAGAARRAAQRRQRTG